MPRFGRSVISILLLFMVVLLPTVGAEGLAELEWSGIPFPVWVARASETDPAVQQKACIALGVFARRQTNNPTAVNDLGKQINWPGLASIDAALRPLWTSTDIRVRRIAVAAAAYDRVWYAADTIADVRQPYLDLLTRDADAGVRANALDALFNAGVFSERSEDHHIPAEMVAVLEQVCADPHPLPRRRLAVRIASCLRHSSDRVSGVLERLGRDADPVVRRRLAGHHQVQDIYADNRDEYLNNPFDTDVSGHMLFGLDLHRDTKQVDGAELAEVVRMRLWLDDTALTSGTPNAPTSWRTAEPAALPDAIDDLLRYRLLPWACDAVGTEFMALLSERSLNPPPSERAVAALFTSNGKGLTPHQHLAMGQLLEQRGFAENASREYARAAGMTAYFRNGFPNDPEAKRSPRIQREAALAVRRLRQGGDPAVLAALEATLPGGLAAAAEQEPAVTGSATGAASITSRRGPVWWYPDSGDMTIQAVHPIPGGVLVDHDRGLACLRPDGSARWLWRADPKLSWQIADMDADEVRLLTCADSMQPHSRVLVGDPYPQVPLDVLHIRLSDGKQRREPWGKGCWISTARPGLPVIGRPNGPTDIGQQSLLPGLDPVHMRERTLAAIDRDSAVLFHMQSADVWVYARTAGALWACQDGPIQRGQMGNLVACETYHNGTFACGDLGADRWWRSVDGVIAIHQRTTGALLLSYVDERFTCKGRQPVRIVASAAGPDGPIHILAYPHAGIVAITPTGQVAWRRWLPSHGQTLDPSLHVMGLASHPCTDGAVSLWLTCGSVIMALDALDGRVRWASLLCDLEDGSHLTDHAVTAPALVDDHCAVSLNNGRVAWLSLARLAEQAGDREADQMRRLADLLDGNHDGALAPAVLLGFEDPAVRTAIAAHAPRNEEGTWAAAAVAACRKDPKTEALSLGNASLEYAMSLRSAGIDVDSMWINAVESYDYINSFVPPAQLEAVRKVLADGRLIGPPKAAPAKPGSSGADNF